MSASAQTASGWRRAAATGNPKKPDYIAVFGPGANHLTWPGLAQRKKCTVEQAVELMAAHMRGKAGASAESAV